MISQYTLHRIKSVFTFSIELKDQNIKVWIMIIVFRILFES